VCLRHPAELDRVAWIERDARAIAEGGLEVDRLPIDPGDPPLTDGALGEREDVPVDPALLYRQRDPAQGWIPLCHGACLHAPRLPAPDAGERHRHVLPGARLQPAACLPRSSTGLELDP